MTEKEQEMRHKAESMNKLNDKQFIERVLRETINPLIVSLEKNSSESAKLTKWLIGVTIVYTIITAAGVIVASFNS